MSVVFGMIGLALRRLRSRMALTLLSLLGVALAVGLVSSVPVFAQAVSYLVLNTELSDTGANTNRPPLLMHLTYDQRKQPFTLAQSRDMEQRLAHLVAEKTGLSPRRRVTKVESPTLFLRSAADGPQYDGSHEKLVFRGFVLVVLSDAEQEMQIIEGQSFAEVGQGERVAVWTHLDMANTLGVHAGEPYDLYLMGSSEPLPIYIAGIWREGDARSSYWATFSLSRDGSFVVRPDDYERFAEPMFADGTGSVGWSFVSPVQDLTLDKVNTFAGGLEVLPALVENSLPTARLDVSPIEKMRTYATRRNSLSDLLMNFSLPAIGLLFYFLSLLSTVIVQFQREETAIMAGRGAGSGFVLGMTVVETLVLIMLGTPLGLGAGWLMARVMGQTSGFLTFVDRPGFPVSLSTVNWRLVLLALAVLLVARLIPTLSASRRSLVVHLRERGRQVNVSAAVKLAVDVPLILITAYAYRQLRLQDVPSLIRIDTTKDALPDPVLILSPLVCVLAGALVLSHLFPLIMRPLDAISRRLPWLSVYMGVRRLHGQSGQYASALFLVIICLSLGAFYSSMALSVDQWLHDRVYYATGADYTFQQGVVAGSGGAEASGSGAWVVPLGDYLGISSVQGATRAGDFDARIESVRGGLRLRLLGIDRLSFPQVGFWRGDFSSEPLGELLNRLGRVRNGVLMSRQAMKQYNVLEGQKLTLDVTSSGAAQKVDFSVIGAYDLFPTAYPRQAEMLIGNLDYIFEQTGDPSQYRVWLKTSGELTGSELDQKIQAMGVLPQEVRDARLLLQKDGERAERIGIFGVLSIGFIAGSILSWLGLLVYTSASMQGRMQQIGVLKAIGVQTYQALLMEGVEYLGVIVYGVLGGILSGTIASYLFVPFFQFNVTAATAVPPFLPYIDWTRISWFAIIFAAALILSEIAILFQTTRKDIFQALRMGQRE